MVYTPSNVKVEFFDKRQYNQHKNPLIRNTVLISLKITTDLVRDWDASYISSKIFQLTQKDSLKMFEDLKIVLIILHKEQI